MAYAAGNIQARAWVDGATRVPIFLKVVEMRISSPVRFETDSLAP